MFKRLRFGFMTLNVALFAACAHSPDKIDANAASAGSGPTPVQTTDSGSTSATSDETAGHAPSDKGDDHDCGCHTKNKQAKTHSDRGCDAKRK